MELKSSMIRQDSGLRLIREIVNDKIDNCSLLDNDKLVFGEDDLIGLEPYHARQIASSGQVKTQLNMYPGKVSSSVSSK